MGNLRLGELPRSKKWRDVVDLIVCGADTPQVARATLSAAETGFQTAADDPRVVDALWLLTQLPVAARAGNFAEALREAGLSIDAPPSLMELCGAVSDCLDRQGFQGCDRSDVGEMAQMALVESLQGVVGSRLKSLFAISASDVQREIAGFGTTKQFGVLARDFCARFTERYLDYFLSRTLSAQVGPDQRFATLTQQRGFSAALRVHCKEATKIMETFAGEWFSKTNWEAGGISRRKAAGFLRVAMRKVTGELRAGSGLNVE